MVLGTIWELPYLLFCVLLKYSDTRSFNVREKSEPTDLENAIFLMISNLINNMFTSKTGKITFAQMDLIEYREVKPNEELLNEGLLNQQDIFSISSNS